MIYLIFYVGSFFVSLGGLGLVLFYLKNPQKYGYERIKLEQIDFIGTLERCGDYFQNKKSAVLIYLAQKGFIKIRRQDGRIFIDKIKSFDDMEYFKQTMDNLYAKYVSYYGDDNAIMSYETVAWDEAKKEFRNSIRDLIKDNQIKPEESSAKDIEDRKTGFDKLINTILFFMWAFCLMPIAITYASGDMSDEWAAMFALYFLVGIMYAVLHGMIKVIKFADDDFGKFKGVGGLLGLIFGFIRVIIKVLMILFIFCEFIFFIAVLSVAGEYFKSMTLGLNAILEVVMIAVTLILVFVKYRYRKMETGSYDRTIKHLLRLRTIRKLPEKEEQDNAILLASVFDKVNDLKKEGLKEEVPDWYEGNEWNGLEDLMLVLDGKK